MSSRNFKFVEVGSGHPAVTRSGKNAIQLSLTEKIYDVVPKDLDKIWVLKDTTTSYDQYTVFALVPRNEMSVRVSLSSVATVMQEAYSQLTIQKF